MGKTKHSGPVSLPKKPDPSLWVSKVPFGLGKVKPKHIRDTLKTAWDNRDQLPYAARILRDGVCDGCALGVSGLKDQTLEGPHLCTTRLNVLRLNTMPAMSEEWLYAPIERLREMNSSQLRELGRIPYPLLRECGDERFRRISWEEALDRAAEKIRSISPKQLAFYLTSRGITNESYYVAAKAARFLGTNHIDNASRICHSPSKTALKRSLGIGASSCSYKDWIGTDVLVFWGSVAANNQPVSTKYMYAAKRMGTKIIVINPYREPAMDGYWIPSVPESALFGTQIADHFYQVHIGGDIAMMYGIIKSWMEMEAKAPGSAIDHAFVREHVDGYEELAAKACELDWNELEQTSGLSRHDLSELADLLAKARSGVFVWSMGLTQHRFGTDNISQVANLALLRGFIGREHCGMMPIRGHSGVQGAGEMGADPFSLPGGEFNPLERQRMEHIWGFPLPTWQGDIVGTTLDKALLPLESDERLRMYYMSGGNFLETMPRPDYVQEALQHIELRIHQDIIFNTSTLLDAKEAVLVLPAMTRYEQTGGGTSTSTERMVYFSPEIPGPRIGEAKPEWEIYTEVAKRVRPDASEQIHFESAAHIRAEIALAAPNYDGIQHLHRKGDVFQWGGAWLCEDGICPTDNGKGKLIAVDLPNRHKADGDFFVTTRRGKQFNSMVYSDTDPFNNAGRYDLLLHPDDARKLGFAEGEQVVAENEHGVFYGYVRTAPLKKGNIELYWPEGNVIMPQGVYEPHAGIPEYNTTVRLLKLEDYVTQKDLKSKNKKKADQHE